MFSRAWLLNALHVIAFAFIVSFVGAVSSAGLNVLNISTLKAAAVAGVSAAVAALQGLLAPLVSQPTTNSTASLLTAVRSRIGTTPPPVGQHFASEH